DEVQLFVTHNLNQTFVLLREGGGDAHIADTALFLEFSQQRQLSCRVSHIVDLDQINHLLAHALEGCFQLLACSSRISAATTAGNVELGCPEQIILYAELLNNTTGHLFRGPVAGSRVEHLATELMHARKNRTKCADVFSAGNLGESGRTAKAYSRNGFAG